MAGLFPGFDSGGCAVASVEDGDVLDFGLVGEPGDPLHRSLGFPEGRGQLPGLIVDHPVGFDLRLPGRPDTLEKYARSVPIRSAPAGTPNRGSSPRPSRKCPCERPLPLCEGHRPPSSARTRRPGRPPGGRRMRGLPCPDEPPMMAAISAKDDDTSRSTSAAIRSTFTSHSP